MCSLKPCNTFGEPAQKFATSGTTIRSAAGKCSTPILTITLVLSIIWTFSDFQVVYSLTKGGPVNSTHVLATLSYQIGLQAGKISEGVAISLTMLPLLLILVVFQLRQLRRSGGA